MIKNLNIFRYATNPFLSSLKCSLLLMVVPTINIFCYIFQFELADTTNIAAHLILKISTI